LSDTGAQPLTSQDGKITLAVNGEIYNHIALRASVGTDVKFKTHSDCEVIMPLVCALLSTQQLTYKSSILFQYRQHGKDLCSLLDGMFSFVLLDESVSPSRIIAARDPIGITTLYQGWSSERPGAVFFASELKALVDDCDKIISFPPGNVYDSLDQSTSRYYQPKWWDGDSERPEAFIPTMSPDLTLIRETLEAAVRKRLMSEVPYGVLLSGGLDSSLIAAIASRETEKIAQAQYELRQKKLQEASSGPTTPKNGGLVNEQGRLTFWPDLQSLMFLLSYPRRLATATFLFYRSGKFSRSLGG
jgi:asparagine synthase (glutamine-hydrolysing)